jgi:N-acetyl-1-D-myo-inositol-2-amino-2-deoxy-alpha-D-glucopyranoside deacetylase
MIERVLFVHAHPDDETITTGATIATLVDRGAAVTLLTLTRGERGEVIPAELASLEGDLEGLAEVREAELAEALAHLGVSDHRFLGNPDARWAGRTARRYVDSGMRWGARGAEASGILDPASLTAADLGEVASDIAAVMLDVEPDVVISYGADGGYGHPDHLRAHEATRIAAVVLKVPFYVIGTGAVEVDSLPVLDRKRAALAAHRTQLTVDGDYFSLSSGPPQSITAPEHFSRYRAVRQSFSDLSLWTRIATGLLAFVLGGFVGALLTVAHQASAQIAGVAVAWGIIVALVITLALLVGLRLVFETRIVPAVAAAGLLLASGLLALSSSTGSVLVPDNPVGWIWTFAPMVITAAVLAWPQTAWRRGSNIDLPALKGSDLP